MENLVSLTSDELMKKVAEIDRRRAYLETTEGRLRAADHFIAMFKVMAILGYRLDDSEKMLKAKLWCDLMSEEIAVYGFDIIEQAFKNFASHDLRDYRAFPMPSDIKAECKKLGKNPKAELGRRRQAQREAELEAQANEIIEFADENVKAICVQNWDTNSDGELSYAEAAAVTDIGEIFRNNPYITSFDEFRNFTYVTSIDDYAFQDCSRLTSFTCLATNPPSLGSNVFNGMNGTIFVPAASVEAYKAADGWKDHASQIQAIP